jgi:hypothetical protein
MIVFREVPGLTKVEVLKELIEISNDNVTTGHGGVVVDELSAYKFLRAYLIIIGKIEDDQKPEPVAPQVPEPEVIQVPEPEVTQVRTTTRGRK